MNAVIIKATLIAGDNLSEINLYVGSAWRTEVGWDITWTTDPDLALEFINHYRAELILENILDRNYNFDSIHLSKPID